MFESLVILWSLGVYFIIGRDILHSGFHGFVKYEILSNRLTYYMACLLSIACIPFRFLELFDVEIWLLALASPLYWISMGFYLRVFEYTGHYITMIERLVRDFLRWLLVMAVFLLGWVLATYQQYREVPGGVDPFLTIEGTLMTNWRMCFADIPYTDVRKGTITVVGEIIFLGGMFLGYVVMFNMLIAQMSRTFEKIEALSRKIWKNQWAAMVLAMERTLTKKEKIRMQSSYLMDIRSTRVTEEGVNLEAEKVSTEDTRAMMVILTMENTETARRKKRMQSWKDASRVIGTGTYQHEEDAATVSAIKFDNLSSMIRMGDEITDIESDDESSIYEPFTTFTPNSGGILANAGIGYSSDSSV